MAMSKAIVTSENSSMFSMGTDRLLDIFTFQSNDNKAKKGRAARTSTNLDALDDFYGGEEYASLSVSSFIDSFRRHELATTKNE